MKPNSQSPLANKTFVITRPIAQSLSIKQLIQQAGGECIDFPLMQISPLADYQQFDEQLKNLNQFDFAIFISANAVEYAMNRIHALQISLPKRLSMIAVGPATQSALQNLGVEKIISPISQFDSEGILQLPALQQIAGRHILIFKGIGGREHLAQVLAERGAKVVNAECYMRQSAQKDSTVLDSQWQTKPFDAVLITSSEAMRYFLQVARDKSWLSQVTLVVNHPRVAEQASGLDTHIVVATSTDDSAMYQALLQEFH